MVQAQSSRARLLVFALLTGLVALVLPLSGAADAGTGRIVGGSQAAAGELPWQVALLQGGVSDPFNAQFCGGSLVTTTHVLTAAHCVNGSSPSQVDVLAGTIRLSTGGQRIDVKKITVHPMYSPSTSAWDFAVLELMAPAAAPAAPIPFAGSADGAFWTPGTVSTTSGWGALTEGGSFPDFLYKVQVPIVADTVCDDYYGSDLKADSMVCAGLLAGGKDSCQGDSGGPLAVQKPDTTWLLVGVVSWGDGCARPEAYGVYSEVAAANAWITAQLTPTGGTAPTVTLLNPATAGPGAQIVIQGTNFTGATAVQFGATNASFIVKSPTKIKATVPAGTGAVNVTVTTAGGTSATGPANLFTYTGGGGGGPTVTSVSPTTAPDGSATKITVTGTNLSGVTAVTFNGISATFVSDSPTSLRTRAPLGCSGLVDIRVTTPAGTSPISAGSHFTCT